MGLISRKTVFDIIMEADNDAEAVLNTDITDNNNDNAGNNTNNNQDQNNENDDNIEIDTSLNDIDEIDLDDNETNADNDNASDNNTESTTSSNDNTDPNEEVNDNNTDIFSSLTAEEQSIKIAEQKRAFNDLYTSCDDAINKLDSLNTESIDLDLLGRISDSLKTLKDYIKDYIFYQYPLKSYIENDIFFNRFCANFDAINSILETIGTNK